MGEDSLGGRNVRRATAAEGVSARRGTDPPGRSRLWSRGSWVTLSGAAGESNAQESMAPREGRRSSEGKKALKAKPQERSGSLRGDQGSAAGSKPSRASNGARESAHRTKRRGRKVARLDASRGVSRATTQRVANAHPGVPQGAHASRIRREASAVEDRSPGGESQALTRRKVRATEPGADPPVALKGGARRGQSPSGRGNPVEFGAAR